VGWGGGSEAPAIDADTGEVAPAWAGPAAAGVVPTGGVDDAGRARLVASTVALEAGIPLRLSFAIMSFEELNILNRTNASSS
jgi:hypothetical protein